MDARQLPEAERVLAVNDWFNALCFDDEARWRLPDYQVVVGGRWRA